MFTLKYKDNQLLFTVALIIHITFTVITSAYDLKDYFEQSLTPSFIRATVFSLLITKILFDGLKFSLWQIIVIALVALQALISHSGSLLYIYICNGIAKYRYSHNMQNNIIRSSHILQYHHNPFFLWFHIRDVHRRI